MVGAEPRCAQITSSAVSGSCEPSMWSVAPTWKPGGGVTGSPAASTSLRTILIGLSAPVHGTGGSLGNIGALSWIWNWSMSSRLPDTGAAGAAAAVASG